MKAFNVCLVTFLTGAVTSVIHAAESAYNCRNQAVLISASAVEQSVPTVRQWEPDYQVARKNADGSYARDENGDIIFDKVGRWYDGGDDTLAESNQLGCCWLHISLRKGQDYVFRVTNGVGVVSLTAGDGVASTFKEKQAGGFTYKYIYADEWSDGDAAIVDYYVHIFRGVRKVGENFNVLFAQKSIDDFVPPDIGTERNPVVLDMSQDGRVVIPDSTERRSDALCTTFQASLKAGIEYYFAATSPSDDMKITVTSAGWDDLAQRAEAVWNTDTENGTFYIKTKIDYTIEILTWPDKDNWTSGNVGGGKLAWGVGHTPAPEKEPEVIAELKYDGSLADDDEMGYVADFLLVERSLDNGKSNFVATVTMEGMKYAFTDDSYGDIKATNEIRGKVWISRLEVEKVNDGVWVSGSLYFDGEDGVDEVWFEGLILQWVDPGADSFEKFNPETDSAAAMGLTCAAFKDEKAGSASLNRLWNWAVLYGVKISQANTMSFDSDGDPIGTLSETYLLACDPETKELDKIKAEFVITSFNPASGVVVAEEFADGDGYGNGFVQVRTSTILGGEYTTAKKQVTDRLFYRAYLVK